MTYASRAYGRTQGETASRERLMVLLFETALRCVRVAATHLDAGRVREAAPQLARATDIVTELFGTLDHARAPELCAQLSQIYLFANARLLVATVDHSAAAARDAEKALAPIADGFAQAVRAVERGQAPAPR
jgi:flagellar protein FliS